MAFFMTGKVFYRTKFSQLSLIRRETIRYPSVNLPLVQRFPFFICQA